MKRYTAQEMRKTADGLKDDPGMDALIIAYMLRQAADMMEREEKRKMKYEYAALFSRNKKPVARSTDHYATLEDAEDSNTYVPYGETISFIRREVGEWEEVEDE